jgi:hypothetical protein
MRPSHPPGERLLGVVVHLGVPPMLGLPAIHLREEAGEAVHDTDQEPVQRTRLIS